MSTQWKSQQPKKQSNLPANYNEGQVDDYDFNDEYEEEEYDYSAEGEDILENYYNGEWSYNGDNIPDRD